MLKNLFIIFILTEATTKIKKVRETKDSNLKNTFSGPSRGAYNEVKIAPMLSQRTDHARSIASIYHTVRVGII